MLLCDASQTSIPVVIGSNYLVVPSLFISALAITSRLSSGDLWYRRL